MTQDPRGCDASTLITLITYTWLSLVAREHPERTPGIPPLGDDNLIPSVPDSMALSLRTKATCYSTTGKLRWLSCDNRGLLHNWLSHAIGSLDMPPCRRCSVQDVLLCQDGMFVVTVNVCTALAGRRVTAQQATCRLVRPTPFRATPMPRRTNYLVPAGLPSNAEDKPSEQVRQGGSRRKTLRVCHTTVKVMHLAAHSTSAWSMCLAASWQDNATCTANAEASAKTTHAAPPDTALTPLT
jgi:hypothetical protein